MKYFRDISISKYHYLAMTVLEQKKKLEHMS